MKYVSFGGLPEQDFRGADPRTVAHILAHIGMIYIPHLFAMRNYERIVVTPLGLSHRGIAFYETYFRNGLAELRYRNQLELNSDIAIDVDPGAPEYGRASYAAEERALLLNGGGKDTAVAAEALGQANLEFTWLTGRMTPAMAGIMKSHGNDRHLNLNFGGSVAKINASARYHGHRPLSSLLGFMSLIPACIGGYRYVVAGNEHSADFANVVLNGFPVNHQYTKSWPFEREFAAYVRAEILENIEYFSILRPLYEIQIAMLFSQYPKYFPVIRSCNVGHRSDYWCLNCYKCAFTGLALAAFLDQEELNSMFAADLFEMPHFRKLAAHLCTSDTRPFECVGTKAECLLALWMARQRHPANRGMAQLAETCGADGYAASLYAKHMLEIDRPHGIPAALQAPVLGYFADRLRLSGADAACYARGGGNA